MRKHTIFIAVTSILLGAATAQADPTTAAPMGDKGSSEMSLGSTSHWAKADTNGDGILSQTELTAAAPNLSTSFTTMDANGDQKLTQDEFKAWHKSHHAADPAKDPSSSKPATKGY
jgi:hypothetical protein